MSMFEKIERDFIERTLTIIDQYDKHVRGKVKPNDEYEVTLLMNCLTGLLIYPQQLAHHEKWSDWLTTVYVTRVASEWGLQESFFISAGHKKKGDQDIPITLEQLTMRNLIRQMRNAAAHAEISVIEDAQKPGEIGFIEFENKELEKGFHLRMPVDHLEKFVPRLAKAALEYIESQN